MARDVHRPAVPPERARRTTRSRPGAAILPAVVFMVHRRAAVGQAHRGHGLAVHAALRLRLLLPRVPHHAARSGTPTAPYWQVGLGYAFIGAGVGLAGTPASHSLTGSVPVRRAGMASATADLQRDLGGAIMQSILGALLTAGYAAAFAKLIAGSSERSVSTNVQSAAHEVVLQRGEHRRAVPAVLEADHRRRTDVVHRRRRLGLRRGAGRDRPRRRARVLHVPEARRRARAPRRVPLRGHRAAPRSPHPGDLTQSISVRVRPQWPGSATPTSRRNGGPPTSRSCRQPGSCAVLVGHVGADAVERQRQPLQHAQQPVRQHGRTGEGRLRARVDLGRARGRASCCSRPGSSGSRGTARSPPPARGASPRLLNELLGTHDIQGLGVNVRIGDGPVFPVVNVAIITALAFGLVAVPRAPAATDLRPRHPAGVRGRDVPGRRVPGRRARRHPRGLRGGGAGAGRVRLAGWSAVDRRGHAPRSPTWGTRSRASPTPTRPSRAPR